MGRIGESAHSIYKLQAVSEPEAHHREILSAGRLVSPPLVSRTYLRNRAGKNRDELLKWHWAFSPVFPGHPLTFLTELDMTLRN
jgi:hypothetical protein